jgi:hypothetical protein
MEEYKLTSIELPPEGVAVMTKIDDKDGLRNESILVRKGGIWFFRGMKFYVYYRPTHWKPLKP